MLAVEINFLTGRYVASAHYDRDAPEWPPHPARLFSALVDIWADQEPPSPVERRALEWLEEQSPPAISLSEATVRSVVTHFVPVNHVNGVSSTHYKKRFDKVVELRASISELDPSSPRFRERKARLMGELRGQLDVTDLVSTGKRTPDTAAGVLPPGWFSQVKMVTRAGKTESRGVTRTGRERRFPSVTPDQPRVTYLWDSRPSEDISEALDCMLGRISRIGHSSSLVACRLNPEPPEPDLVPGVGGRAMRTVQRGQLAALEKEFASHGGVRPRHLPFAATLYQPPRERGQERLVPDTAGEMVTFEFEGGPKPLIQAVPELTRAFRAALIRYAVETMPERASGHRPDGSPSQEPHVGFYGLPWVASRYASGHLMGMALGFPHDLDPESRKALLVAVINWEQREGNKALYLDIPGGKSFGMKRVKGPSHIITLRPDFWSKPSRRWVSATPIALPHHPGRFGPSAYPSERAKAWKRAEHLVRRSCSNVGLPNPSELTLSAAPFVAGSAPSHRYPPFRQGKSGVRRSLVHAALLFDQPVEGPLLIGAGRYTGMGLMKPLGDEGAS